jgi:hypothetical protein
MRFTDWSTIDRTRLETTLDVMCLAVFAVSGVFRTENPCWLNRFNLISCTEPTITDETRLEMFFARRCLTGGTLIDMVLTVDATGSRRPAFRTVTRAEMIQTPAIDHRLAFG